MEFLREVTIPGRFPLGMMSAADLFFAGAMASLLCPELTIEIGTASGFSAAVLAKVIALRWEEAGGAKHVFDHWPDEKIGAGIFGAVRLPIDRRSLGKFVRQLRDLPSEVSPGSWAKRWREIDALAPTFS